MRDKYQKKEAFEYCEIRKTMVRLEVIQATVAMPDFAHAELRLMPVGCNLAAECKQRGIRCTVYDPDGLDPCPEAWRGD